MIDAHIYKNAEYATKQPLLEFTKKVVEQWTADNDEVNDWRDDISVDESEVDLGRRFSSTWEKVVTRRCSGQHFPEIIESIPYEVVENREVFIKHTNPRGSCKVCRAHVASKCQQCEVFVWLK